MTIAFPVIGTPADMPVFGAADVRVIEQVLSLRSPAMDTLTHFLLASDIRIGFLAALLFYLWFSPRDARRFDGGFVVSSSAAIFFAMVVGFIARHIAPDQPRPRLAMPTLDFPPLDGLGHLADYHSFPSDTATLAAAITALIVVRSRRLGIVAIAWTIIAVSFPRIYVGYHYLSDILAGLLLGSAVALMVYWLPGVFSRWGHWLRERHETHPAATVLGLALVAHEIGTMFPIFQFLGASMRAYAQP